MDKQSGSDVCGQLGSIECLTGSSLLQFPSVACRMSSVPIDIINGVMADLQAARQAALAASMELERQLEEAEKAEENARQIWQKARAALTAVQSASHDSDEAFRRIDEVMDVLQTFAD